jgi:hypothetical protein
MEEFSKVVERRRQHHLILRTVR